MIINAITPSVQAKTAAPPRDADDPMRNADVHVVPNGESWTLKIERLNMSMPRYETQAEAIGLGIRIAREMAVQLIIHGQNGQFRDVWNYGR